MPHNVIKPKQCERKLNSWCTTHERKGYLEYASML